MYVSDAVCKNTGLATWNLFVKLPCEPWEKAGIPSTDLWSKKAAETRSFPTRLALLQLQHKLFRKLLPRVLLQVVRL